MKTVLIFLGKMATKRGLAILLTFYAAVFGAILFTLSKLTTLTGGIGILDFDRGYTTERVAEVFGSYGVEGMALYSRIQVLDIFNPAIYSIIFASLLYLLWRTHRAAWVVFLPFLAGGLDYAENVTLFALSRAYPNLPSGLVSASSLLSIVKNVALFASIAALVVGLAIFAFQRLRKSD